MDILNAAFLILGGSACGLLAGLLGFNEGLLLVPLILASERLGGSTSLASTHIAIGTSLSVVAVVSATAAFRARRGGQILARAAFLAGGAAVIGAATGCVLAAQFEGKTLQQIFGAVAGIVALRMLGDVRKPSGDQRMAVGRLLGTGIASGSVSALTGIGASVVAAPMLYSVHRFPFMKAAGTASVLALVSALSGAAGFVIAGWGELLLPQGSAGFSDPLRCLLLLIGTVPCVLLGEGLAGRVKGKFPRKLFALFLLVIALKMLFF